MRAIGNAARAGKRQSCQTRNRLGLRERAGVVPAFRSSVELRPIKTSRNKRRKRNAGKRRSPTAASCDAARALLERARLSAFHRGSHLREYFIPKARLQARLPGTWSERALPAFACPSPGMHLPPRSSCREADTQAAREQAANPPAGTALAPMTRCASAPCPSRERGLYCNWNGD
jgi:hypothetical protein